MAMNYTELPLFSDPVWTMTFALENVNRTINFYWNDRQSTWHFDVLNDQNVPVMLGVRMVENYPIAVDYAFSDKEFNGYFVLEDAGETPTNLLDSSIGAMAKYYRLIYAYEV